MGCPENSFERMCREVDRIMSDKLNTNFDISFDEVLNRVKAYNKHNPKFYYNSGIATRNVFVILLKTKETMPSMQHVPDCICLKN